MADSSNFAEWLDKASRAAPPRSRRSSTPLGQCRLSPLLRRVSAGGRVAPRLRSLPIGHSLFLIASSLPFFAILLALPSIFFFLPSDASHLAGTRTFDFPHSETLGLKIPPPSIHRKVDLPLSESHPVRRITPIPALYPQPPRVIFPSLTDGDGLHPPSLRLPPLAGPRILTATSSEKTHMILRIVASVACALGSAVFGGLTLGLMSLDVLQLRVLIDADTSLSAGKGKGKIASGGQAVLSSITLNPQETTTSPDSRGNSTTGSLEQRFPVTDAEKPPSIKITSPRQDGIPQAREDSAANGCQKTPAEDQNFVDYASKHKVKKPCCRCCHWSSCREERKRRKKAEEDEDDRPGRQTRVEARRAKSIYRVRQDGNFLLVTMLIGNVMVNSGFSILMGNLTSGLMGFFVSTFVLTIFGEIIPQAVCSRYGLEIGYYFIPFIIFIEIIFFPVAKPIALLLDYFLGSEVGTNFNREQLKAFVGHHHTDVKLLAKDEAKIMTGGLDFALKVASAVMTPLSQVFGLDINAMLDYETAAEMVTKGYSRVPIFDRSQPHCTVGLLHVKDIVLLEPSLCLPVRHVLPMFGRPVYTVDADTALGPLLSVFKRGHTHLAVVRQLETDPNGGDPFYRHIGIICLEDILEEILQDEIYDEYEAPRKPKSSQDQIPPAVEQCDSQSSLQSRTGSLKAGSAHSGLTETHESQIEMAQVDEFHVCASAEDKKWDFRKRRYSLVTFLKGKSHTNVCQSDVSPDMSQNDMDLSIKKEETSGRRRRRNTILGKPNSQGDAASPGVGYSSSSSVEAPTDGSKNLWRTLRGLTKRLDRSASAMAIASESDMSVGSSGIWCLNRAGLNRTAEVSSGSVRIRKLKGRQRRRPTNEQQQLHQRGAQLSAPPPEDVRCARHT